MAVNGINSENLDALDNVDELLGLDRSAGAKSGRVLIATLAGRIAGEGAVANLIAETAQSEAAVRFASIQALANADANLAAADVALGARIDTVEEQQLFGVKWTIENVRVRSPKDTNVDITTGLVNGAVLNGVTLVTGDFVFLGWQSLPAENGIYIVVASGTATRASWANSAAKLARIGFVIDEGDFGAGERRTLPLAEADITLGTTALVFGKVGSEVGVAATIAEAKDGFPTLKAKLDNIEIFKEFPTDIPGDILVATSGGRLAGVINATSAALSTLPRTEAINAHALPRIRSGFELIRYGASIQQFSIGFLGDSWVAGYFVPLITKRLRAALGNAGEGWLTATIGTGTDPIAIGADGQSRLLITGAWSLLTGQNAVSLRLRSTTEVGAKLKFTLPATAGPLGDVWQHYEATAAGEARYRWNEGDWTTIDLSAGTGPSRVDISAGKPVSGANAEYEIECLGGEVAVSGLDLRAPTTGGNATSGVRIYNIGVGGSAASSWLAADATAWKTQLAMLGLGGMVTLLGTNDEKTADTDEQIALNYGALWTRIDEAVPDIDILAMSPPENAGGGLYRMPGITALVRLEANRRGLAHIDLQYTFGPVERKADYIHTGSRPMLIADGLHPDLDGSGGITRALADVML